MEIFKDNSYKYISNLVESKMPILRQNEDFNKKYVEQSDLIDKRMCQVIVGNRPFG